MWSLVLVAIASVASVRAQLPGFAPNGEPPGFPPPIGSPGFAPPGWPPGFAPLGSDKIWQQPACGDPQIGANRISGAFFPRSATAQVRCCTFSTPVACVSPSGSTLFNFSDANKLCASLGYGLCSKQDLTNGACCRLNGEMVHHYTDIVWTSTPEEDHNYVPPAGSVSTDYAPCPVGSYCVGGADADKYDCTCARGYYCPKLSTQPQGVICPAGYYCAGLTADKIPCSALPGRYCPAGSQSQSGDLCPPGYFCPGSTSEKMPCTCDVGHFCPKGSKDPVGEPCPAGHYCAGGTAHPEACRARPGFFCGVGAKHPAGEPCPAGYYCTGLSSPKRDCRCQAGSYCPPQSSNPSGSSCPAGFFCTGGMSDKHPCECAPGNYCAEGSSSPLCAPCPAGFFCIGHIADKQICNAAPGFFCPEGGRYEIGHDTSSLFRLKEKTSSVKAPECLDTYAMLGGGNPSGPCWSSQTQWPSDCLFGSASKEECQKACDSDKACHGYAHNMVNSLCAVITPGTNGEAGRCAKGSFRAGEGTTIETVPLPASKTEEPFFQWTCMKKQPCGTQEA